MLAIVQALEALEKPWFVIYITAEVWDCNADLWVKATTAPIVVNASPTEAQLEIITDIEDVTDSDDPLFEDLFGNFDVTPNLEATLKLGTIRDDLSEPIFLQEISVSDI